MKFLAFSLEFESDSIGNGAGYDMRGIYSGSIYKLPDTLNILLIEKESYDKCTI